MENQFGRGWPGVAYLPVRQHENEENRRDEDNLVEEGIAQPDGEGDPGIGREETDLRGEVIGVAAQPAQWLGPQGAFRVFTRQRLKQALNLVEALVRDPGGEELMDVSAAGDSGKIVEGAEFVERGEALEHAEIEGGTADASTGEADSL